MSPREGWKEREMESESEINREREKGRQKERERKRRGRKKSREKEGDSGYRADAAVSRFRFACAAVSRRTIFVWGVRFARAAVSYLLSFLFSRSSRPK